MPTNTVSAARCTIKLITPPSTSASTKPTKTACQEYSQQSITDPVTGAFKEIVTIESKQSSRFQISFQVHHTAYDLLERTKPSRSSRSTATDRPLKSSDYVVDFFLDGISIGGGYHQHHTQTPRRHTISAFPSSNITARPLQFAPLHLVDPDDYPQDLTGVESPAEQVCQDEEIIRSLGTIEVKITRCELSLKERRSNRKRIRLRPTSNDMMFSESIKKARLSSTAGLGQPTFFERENDRISYRVRCQDPNPFLHFIFKYKPRAVLIAEGILPPPIISPELPVEGASTSTKQKPDRKSSGTENRMTIESDPESEKEESRVIKKETREKKAGCKREESNRRSGPKDDCKKRGTGGERNGQIDQKPRRVSSQTDRKPELTTRTKEDIKPSKPMFIDLTL
ncbi:hypothetical protein PGT21_033034 [Puccinia graminis f. sp. tritici]|uniref:DUF7918 domain-containing protein n=1 Tax=Puccinia graminis f. sp. tritici TaxID=56615 RepID=A0A5B0LK46_PUCGR|nr:hypothetical protein PGTUg99_008384 [Puccinia graminis f. sp. tritici]KAA1094936.1 hypothetical protein PGT21_033034 [Puccinia graminis f. sp. tritici]